jgi:hypothetical protein
MDVISWKARHNARARATFAEASTPDAVSRRLREIAALDTKDWRGRRLYRLTCAADFGRGPHDQFVPEGLLWTLIDLRHYRCPFHC